LKAHALPQQDPGAEYAARLQTWRTRIAALDRRHLRLSNSRLALAAVGAVVLWLAFIRTSISPWWPVAAGLGFVALVIVHARLLTRLDRARRAEAWYLRGLDRLAGRWIGRGRGGARFVVDHPYARDLDLFGRGSLFELMNTATTEAGEETLAEWLRRGAAIAEVRARQQAVGELRSAIDFREDLSVLAAESEVSRTGALAAWGEAPPAGLTSAIALVLAGCGAMTVAVVAVVFAEWIAARWLLAWLITEGAIAMIWRRRIHLVLSRIATADRDLALLSEVLARIEAESFTSPRLAAIVAALVTDGVPPSRRIARLRRLVSWLDSTRNQMFAPFALAILLPQQLAVAIDRWHAAYGPRVVEWLNALGELEALAAIGTYAFEHPADPFPVLSEDSGPLFHARALAHPLMSEQASIRNDLDLGGDAVRVVVISGSNMSGKSTLLRSAGVNTVLALAGAPVRAASLTLSPLVIGATLKVEDSLQAGHSRFYAEILRIRTIVDAARGPVPLLFLLDEILHGTNSYDRRIGAEAIVRALAQLGAIGLVTTHDLALTELPARLSVPAANMHFEDRLVDGTMVFDYQIRPGVVEHSNALALMRAVGLEV
jgi:hypothetical protein